MLNEGNHRVNEISDWCLGESAEKGTPFIGIELTTITDELACSKESIWWFGYLSDKMFKKGGKDTNMIEQNMETLYKLGFKSSRVTDLADDTKTFDDLFNHLQDKIVMNIEHEEVTREDGSTYTVARVKYINVGSSINKLDKAQAVTKFASFNLDGKLAQIKKNLGSHKVKEVSEQEKATPVETQIDINPEDVPF